MAGDRLAKEEFLRSTINDILSEMDGADPVDELRGSMSLTDDLGLDSLDLAEMTVRLEERYDVDVFEDDVVDKVDEVLAKLDQ